MKGVMFALSVGGGYLNVDANFQQRQVTSVNTWETL